MLSDARPGTPLPGDGTPSPDSLPELGQRLELLGRLGAGGFAVVHRARDRATGRDVALKLLHQDRAGNQASLARFYREGELAARLEHPGIVRVHAAGTWRGQPCLVYELIEGARPLAEVLPEWPLPRRLEAVRDVARALGWAHSHGVVHRDVKPENALVDPEGRVRLTDFGLAAAGDLERLTRSGAVMGTPYYMSPEQLTGSRDVIGPQSDVWGLGVMLYQALTDRLPFSSQSLTALAVEVVTGVFSPPSRVSGEVVSRDLETVCLHALQPRPADRYPDAQAFAEDLQRVLTGERPLARRRRRVSRRLLLVALVLAPPLLAGGVLLLPGGSPPSAAGGSAPEVSSVPAARPLTAGEELDGLLAGDEPWERGAAAEAWLARHPDHPRAGEARAAAAAARGAAPLRVFAWGEQERVPVFLQGSAFVCASVFEPPLRRGLADTGRELPAWPGVPGLMAIVPHPQGGFLLACPGAVRWLVPAGDELQVKLQVPVEGLVRALALAPRRGLLAVAEGEQVVVVRLADGQRLAALPTGEQLSAVRFSPDERLLVAGGVDARKDEISTGSIHAWSGDGFAPAWQREAVDGFYCLAFTPDGSTLAAGTRSCLVALLDPADGTIRDYLQGEGIDQASIGRVAHDYPVKGLAISPDGRRLYTVASASDKQGGELGVWELPSGRPLGRVVRTSPHRPSSVAIDASGRLLVLGTTDGEVLSWATPP